VGSSPRGLAPKKSLGQNFLVDPLWVSRIVEAFGVRAGECVVEIGPGKGVLTAALLERGCHVIAVEIDARMVGHLRERFEGEPRLTIVHEDFLRLDLGRAAAGRPVRVIGNLPYHVTSSILMRVLDEVRRGHEDPQGAARIVDFAVMIQREVAQRILSAAGSREYGILSVFVDLFFDGEPLADVPPAAFFPRPKVQSRVIRLRPLPAPRHGIGDWAIFRRVVRGAFNQRRKMLRRSLAALPGLPPIDAVPGAVPWLTQRPEQLPSAEFTALAAAFEQALAQGLPAVGLPAATPRRPGGEPQDQASLRAPGSGDPT
jgi:16S rRNA (adenine1518-N6/adenine1519-N6)-dimethyltransferase